MVIIFVVLVFVLIQVNLAYRVSGQDATLNTMREQIASLGEMLNVERNQNADLSAELDRITSQLLIAEESRDDLSRAAGHGDGNLATARRCPCQRG